MARVTVRYFAVLREKKGLESEVIDVPDGTTLSALYERLFPGLGLSVGFSRNKAWAKKTDVAVDGDEIGLLPPLGGG